MKIIKKIFWFPFVLISALGVDYVLWNGLFGEDHYMRSWKECWHDNWEKWKNINN
jgi:hypothetical protein